MNIINQNNTNHEIKIIPRFYILDDLVFELYNERTKSIFNFKFAEILLLQNSHFILMQNADYILMQNSDYYYNLGGYYYFNFQLNTFEGEKFQIKIIGNNKIIYRGKLMATSQNTQNFKASNENYYYE